MMERYDDNTFEGRDELMEDSENDLSEMMRKQMEEHFGNNTFTDSVFDDESSRNETSHNDTEHDDGDNFDDDDEEGHWYDWEENEGQLDEEYYNELRRKQKHDRNGSESHNENKRVEKNGGTTKTTYTKSYSSNDSLW